MGKFSIWDDEKVLELDSSDDSTTMCNVNVLNATEQYTEKWLSG